MEKDQLNYCEKNMKIILKKMYARRVLEIFVILAVRMSLAEFMKISGINVTKLRVWTFWIGTWEMKYFFNKKK